MSRPFFHARKSPFKLLHIFRHSSPLRRKMEIHRTNGFIGNKHRHSLAFRGLLQALSPFARPLPSKRTNLDLCSRLSWMPFTRRRACAVERVLWGRFPSNIRYIGALNVRPASERERKTWGQLAPQAYVRGTVRIVAVLSPRSVKT